MSGSDILTTFEAASLCKVSYNTIKNWIKRDLLPAYRTAGGHLRIRFADLESFSKQYAVPLHEKLDPKKRRVLIVDKSDHFVNAFMDAFSHYRERLSVNMVSDPFEAGLHIAAHKPDIVFMAKEVTGFEAAKYCARIRKFLPSRQTKIVLLMTEAEKVAETMQSAGADLLLPLPIDKSQLFASVESFLAVKSGVRAGRKRK